MEGMDLNRIDSRLASAPVRHSVLQLRNKCEKPHLMCVEGALTVKQRLVDTYATMHLPEMSVCQRYDALLSMAYSHAFDLSSADSSVVCQLPFILQ